MNLVTNGSFETTTGTVPGQLTFNANITGWTLPSYTTSAANSYDFIFSPGTADTSGATGQYGNLKLHGPGNGTNNGLPATSPDSGNYIAIDTAFPAIPSAGALGLRQTITGLTPGQAYAVSFYDAAAQQFGFSGATTDQFQVTFGTQTQNATFFNLPNHGFSGWKSESLTFSATSTSQVLNFLGVGSPAGLPPFLLLDGVSVTAVPEPSFVWSFGAVAALGLGAALKGKFANKK